jgi:hypothetical protein
MGFTKKDMKAFQSDWLAKEDVMHGPIQATIKNVTEELINNEGSKEPKAVVWFHGDVKPMILNNVNWDTIEMAYGINTDQWLNKPVELYFDPNVSFGAKKVGGVRIRIQTASFGATPFAPANAPPPDLWSLQQAITECAKVGISQDTMVAKLKELGFNGWQNGPCTPAVKGLIAARQSGQLVGAGVGGDIPEEQIPF